MSTSALERLERRLLFAAGGKTDLFGTEGRDQIHFGYDAQDRIVISINTTNHTLGARASLSSIGFIFDCLGGDDVVTMSTNWIEKTRVYGGAGNDDITGGAMRETLLGGEGDDRITAVNSFGSVLIGGAGDDLIRAGRNYSFIFGDSDVAEPNHVGEGLDKTTAAGEDTILGGSSHDYIVAGPARDRIGCGDGRDSVWCGTGNDACDGGPGNDHIEGEGGRDAIQGNEGHDVLIGGDGADRLYGNGGRDIVVGGGGNDFLSGGPTTIDQIFGGSGDDRAAKDEKDLYTTVETLV